MSTTPDDDRQKHKEGAEAIRRLSKPIRGRTFIAQVCTVISAALAFVPYLALVQLGDVFIEAQTKGHPVDAARVHDIVLLLINAFCCKLFFYLMSLAITHFADLHFRALIRQQVSEKLTRVSLSWFTKMSSGKIRALIQDDTKSIHTVIAHAPVDILNGILTPLVLLGFMVVINWRLALLGIATIPIYFVLYGSSMKDMGPKTTTMNRYLANVSSAMVELVSGIKVIKAFGKSGEAHSNYVTAATKFADMYYSWCEPLVGLCSIAAEFVSIPILLVVNLSGGALLFFAGLATLPQILACTLIAIVLPNAMMTVSSIIWSYQLAESAALRIVQLLDTPEIAQAKNAQTPSGKPHVDICNVSYSYGETQALNNVNLTLKPNTLTALIGPSGSGKSTLATLIARFDDPSAGSISLGGIDLRDMTTDELYKHVSFVLQDTMLLSTTVFRNIALARPQARLEEVRAAARVAQIDDFIMSLPHGYDSIIGVDCQLSGGEEQRVAIARAVLANTPILVMDEATAFADPDSEVEIQQALSKLIENRTVLVIAHRINSIVGADQIAIMDNGKIISVGTHDTLQDNQHYQALLQQSGFTSHKMEGYHA